MHVPLGRCVIRKQRYNKRRLPLLVECVVVRVRADTLTGRRGLSTHAATLTHLGLVPRVSDSLGSGSRRAAASQCVGTYRGIVVQWLGTSIRHTAQWSLRGAQTHPYKQLEYEPRSVLGARHFLVVSGQPDNRCTALLPTQER